MTVLLHRRKLVEAATGPRNVGKSFESLYALIRPSVDKKPHHTAAGTSASLD